MICAPAAVRPAFRVGVWGGTAESTARTAQMITPAHKLGVCAQPRAQAQSPGREDAGAKQNFRGQAEARGF
jgi:hypothetical protein